ncbi:hypothetical protein CONPUDRAFT_166537 [Coniophora puteana RWD-64-598 SS2]|uniref:F-box domain-containing protein n=1 Tax=Coniophora puteana (strain RWD-64-598) TaxID=741705 RepID=A0A5M3ML78_CONPW|nr:uncharacterized protein CONPUDRAFT_166537 [Coniophora puteana RWD-64-598 SS2]EIW79843.1 hypothetical protein CONPUDRAFT_166537 [Coniophora puteana RWD-64-598 SS2]
MPAAHMAATRAPHLPRLYNDLSELSPKPPLVLKAITSYPPIQTFNCCSARHSHPGGGMTITILDLPTELLELILGPTIASAHNAPANILCVCRRFASVGHALLYANHSDIGAFLGSKKTPRTLEVDFTGKGADLLVWKGLRDVLKAIWESASKSSNEEGEDSRYDKQTGRLHLEEVKLKLHSYARDTSLHCLEGALSLINPERFSWTGPDPEHHFSIAIVAPVAQSLFSAFGTWTHIRHIKVTNIAFPFPAADPPPGTVHAQTAFHIIAHSHSQSFMHSHSQSSVQRNAAMQPLLPAMPNLESVYIGQAAFLSPAAVAAMFLRAGMMPKLRSVRLVDAYSESIWGARIRRSDVERAARKLVGAQKDRARDEVNTDDSQPIMLEAEAESEEVLEKVREVVSCERMTERIMGGDRVEGLGNVILL